MRLTLSLLSSAIQKRPFYITTPIFYVNAAPHLGHLYTAVVADAIQRFEKLTNPHLNVIFSTGTDEHGTKIQQAAAKAKLPPAQYCDNLSREYRDLFKDFEVQYTDFVRTTEDRHKKAVNHFWRKLKDDDYIYKAKYAGWYSVNDEAFVPEAQTRTDITPEGKIRISVESGHKVEWTEETNYMFRLSAFKTHLQRWLETDGVIQPAKFQRQLLEYLSSETYFPDISVSRPAERVHWAIRVSDDDTQSIYVWLDALVNYLTVTGYPDEDVMKSRGRPWPADLHVVGKDILKFHGIYWPAFLMAARWHPPRRLLVHSHWTVDGGKMSKSLGNTVCPKTVPAPHALRYMLLREATMADDANYSETKFINIANSELADTLGNLVARSCGTVLNPRGERPPLHTCTPPPGATQLLDALQRLPDTCYDHYKNYQFYKAVDAVIKVLHLTNGFFESSKPWELKKRPECQKDLDIVLHITLETVRICAIILQPVIPELTKRILDKLMVPEDSRYWHNLQPTWSINGAIVEAKNIEGGKFVLFPRIYKDKKNQQKKATA
ncbi:methionine--tRNA ligase, mitochondrial [Aricia agestis]|uniref:methionine--tRNA ligase, mitochondrial n=1 Tax=Aricia agestis TaxID=91739 RepID=UPI001C2099B0|nr:methionine--tRNA ligase, mitochondrial [Aricia agestis]